MFPGGDSVCGRTLAGGRVGAARRATREAAADLLRMPAALNAALTAALAAAPPAALAAAVAADASPIQRPTRASLVLAHRIDTTLSGT